MENFNLKKFLVENRLTYNSKLINEEQALSPDDQKIVNDILGSLEEGVFSGVLNKVKSYARKGLITAAVLTALLGAPNLTQAQKQDIRNVAQTESPQTLDTLYTKKSKIGNVRTNDYVGRTPSGAIEIGRETKTSKDGKTTTTKKANQSGILGIKYTDDEIRASMNSKKNGS